MTSPPAAGSVRFWIGLALFTLINLGVWVSSNLQNRPGPGVVRVIDASSAGDLARTGRLDLILDREVFPVEHEGSTLERPPFRVDPPLAGVWRVKATDAVVFEPRDPPPPGRVYRVVLADAHPLFRRYAFDPDTLPTIRYRPLEVDRLRLVDVGEPDASLEGPQDRRARFRIAFNQPVLRSALLGAMKISVDGRVVDPTPIKDRLQEEHAFEIVVRPESFVSIQVAADLTGHDGLLGLGTDLRRSFQIAGNLRDLRAAAVTEWGHRSNRSIRIDFDRKLDPDQDVPPISITPSPGPTIARIRGNSLVVQGNFEWNTSYIVEVDPPLMATDRSLLHRRIRRSVVVPPPEPTLSIPVRRGQLMPDGNMGIPVRHAGYDRMRLRVDRLVDEHLPMVLSEVLDSYEMPSVGERIHDESVPLSVDGQGIDESLIDLATITDRRPGMYRIGATPGDRRWEYASALVLVSDLAVDLQIGGDEILVWTTSVSSGVPVEGVEVTAWAPNITPIRSGVSDADGIARIPLDGASCRVVTARRGDDVVFTRTRLARGIDDRRLAGAEWIQGLDLALHADRGVHRPGETIHLSGIVRTDEGATAGGTPITIEFARPDGKVMTTREVVTDEDQGTFSIDLGTDPLDQTGRWTVTGRLPGSTSRLARIECPVMPFLPVRLDLESSLDPAPFDPDGDLPSWTTPLVSNLVARYLHGAPAADLPGSIVVRRRPVRYRNDRWTDFSFESPITAKQNDSEQKIVTGPDGRATTTIPAPQFRGTWEVEVVSSIRELGGRTTSSTARRIHDTAGRHLGLRLPEGRLHAADTPFTLEVLDLVGDQGRLDGVVDIALESIRNIWTWNPDGRGGRGSWTSVESSTPVTDVSPAEVDAASSEVRRFEIAGLPDGMYRIVTRLEAQGNLPDVVNSIDLHVSRWRTEGRMALERPDRIEILPDRDSHLPGREIGVLLRTPFSGTALVTLETDSIVDARVIEVDGRGTRVDLRLPEHLRDTCFVSATLIRPVDPSRSTWNAVLARGTSRIDLDTSNHRLEPSLLASDAARPGEVVRVSLNVPDAEPGALARIWAVEEGALLATDFRAPDPAEHFLQDRRRSVVSFSTLENLIEDVDRPEGMDRIGGDAARDRREPVPVRLPETKVIWNEFKTLDENASLQLDLEIPDLDGALRVMAVVVDDDRYGSVEHKIGVAPEIQIVGAFPRTMAPGDEMIVPLRIRNNMSHEQSVEITIEAGDGLEVSKAPDEIVVRAGDEAVEPVVLIARSTGAQPIRVVARPRRLKDPGEADGTNPPVIDGTPTHMEWITAVRPPTARATRTLRYLVPAGSTVEIERDDRIETIDGRIDVTIGNSPMIELQPVVDDLIDYPYGCTEQVGSRLAGLLAAIEAPSVAGSRREEGVRGLAATAVSQLWRRQRSDGSLSYWSGSAASGWLTLRTALIVQAAADLDVPIPSGFLEGLEASCLRIAGRADLPRPLACMAVRVLAQAGRPDDRLVEQLLIETESFDLESRAHLAAALGTMGRTDECRRLVDRFTPPPPVAPSTVGRFTSDATQSAVALSVVVEHAPDSAIAPGLYDSILERRGDHGWRTTYENAAAVEAILGVLELTGGQGPASGRVEIAGIRIDHDGEETQHRSIEVAPELHSRSGTTDRIHSMGPGPLSVVVTRSGHPLHNGLEEPEARGVHLERRWYDASNQPIEVGSSVAPGDLVTVEIEWASLLGRPIPNLALVDVLPGGMEFELPGLTTSDASGTRLDPVDNVEFRDDRVIAFATAQTTPRRIRYVMRSVVPGHWTVPGTRAEAMYEMDVHAELPQTTMSILEP